MARPKKDAAAPPKKRGRPPKNKAAEAPKPEAQPQPSTASASGSAIKLPATGVVPRLVKSLAGHAGEIRSITSAMGEMVAKAQENKHVNKKALAWVRMMVKSHESQPGAFAVAFNHFVAYADELGLAKLADEALGMEMGEGETETDDGEDDGHSETATDAEWAGAAPAGKPGLSIVPGPNAPTDVPPAPDEDTEQAA